MAKIDYRKAYELKRQGLTKEQIAKELDCSYSTLSRYLPRWIKQNIAAPEVEFTEVQEILSDGAYKSSKLIRISEEDLKSPTFMMKAHGFNPEEWELVNAKNSIWNGYSKNDYTQEMELTELYASRITVKPRRVFVRFSSIDFSAEPIQGKPIKTGDNLLEIPFMDMHWGNSLMKDYKDTLQKTLHKIEKGYEKIIITIGSDMFHVDNINNTTLSGTIVDQVDLTKAYQDAYNFFQSIIDSALKHSKSVDLIYVKGNHDATFAWSFLQALKIRFPQVSIDDSFDMYKAVKWKQVAIGFSHGNKQAKNIDRVILHDFPWFAKCKVKEIHLGHFHRESMDEFGVMVRVLSTRNKLDSYIQDGGWRANKRFQIFEYTENELESITYV